MISEHDGYAITDAMIRYGGGFVEALGHLWRRADADNKAKLQKAFPEYWAEYRSIANRDEQRHGKAGQP